MDTATLEETLPLILLLLAGGILVLILLRVARAQRESEKVQNQTLTLLQEQVQASVQQSTLALHQLRESMLQSQSQMQTSVDTTRQAMDSRLDNTGQLLHRLQLTLGAVGETNQQILRVSHDLTGLQEALQAPKFRGAFGELFLAELLAQVLPASSYRLQHRFEGGQMVDAVIQLQSGLVPIDAKLPLSAFQQAVKEKDEKQQTKLRKQFVNDVRGHIGSIADKYIRTDEGTFDFALMYIPSESIYYETLAQSNSDGAKSIWAYAIEKRVLPVSPLSFYAYLQTLLLGLKGLQVEDQARSILDLLGRLNKSVEQIQEEHRVLGRHLESAQNKHHEEGVRLQTLSDKLNRMDLPEVEKE